MKKVVVFFLFSFLVLLSGFAAITDYLPADSSLVFVMRDNAANYTSLKNVGIFGFLLSDMGIESMIAQQFESLKYSDPNFKPEDFWGLIAGDIAFFVKGDVDFNALGLSGNLSSDSLDPLSMLPDLTTVLQKLDAALIIRPTQNPDIVLDTWNKLLGINLAWGKDETTGLTIVKDNGIIIVGTNEKAVESAKMAKSNNILSNAVFAKEYNAGNWLVAYSKMNFDTAELKTMVETQTGVVLPEDLFTAVKSDYSISTLKVAEALVFNTFNKYNYTDAQYKAQMIETNVDLLKLYQTTSVPGVIQGVFAMNGLDKMWPDIEEVFNLVLDQLSAKNEVTEKDKGVIQLIFEALKGLKGNMKLGFDFSLDTNMNPLFDIYVNVSMDKVDLLKSLLMTTGEVKFTTANGYSASEILAKNKGDDVDLNLFLSKSEVIISSMAAAQLASVNTLPAIAKNSMFAELSSKYSFKTGHGMIFADLGALLTKLLGIAYPSGMFIEVGLDQEGNSRSIAVIQ